MSSNKRLFLQISILLPLKLLHVSFDFTNQYLLCSENCGRKISVFFVVSIIIDNYNNFYENNLVHQQEEAF